MDNEDRSLSTLVKEIRQQLALRQENLARRLNVSYATVNRWKQIILAIQTCQGSVNCILQKNDQAG
jgi:DNA-binding XRE family transcriptional regulator